MSRAVRYDEYGGVDVLNVVDVADPVPGPGELLVRVRAAGINPGESKIREGLLHERWPATFPSGQGSDLAGVVEAVGAGVDGFGPGDDVIGFTDDRASQAELVVIDAAHATAKPAGVPWEVAGALFVAGATAYAASRAVNPARGRHRGGVRRGRRRRLAHGPAGPPQRRHGHRPGLRAQPRVVARTRRDPGHLRRRGGGSHPRGGSRRCRRVHRHDRRPLCRAGPRARRGSRPDRHDRRLLGAGPGTASRPRATRLGRAPRRWPSSRRSSTRAPWRCRSPPPTRWTRCATPTPSSSATTRGARSSWTL